DVVGRGQRTVPQCGVEQVHEGFEVGRCVALGGHDVDQPGGQGGLGGVAVLAHRCAGERLDHAWAGEADGGAGVGDDHVGQGAVGGVHAAGGRVGEVGEHRQAGVAQAADALGG